MFSGRRIYFEDQLQKALDIAHREEHFPCHAKKRFKYCNRDNDKNAAK